MQPCVWLIGSADSFGAALIRALDVLNRRHKKGPGRSNCVPGKGLRSNEYTADNFGSRRKLQL